MRFSLTGATYFLCSLFLLISCDNFYATQSNQNAQTDKLQFRVDKTSYTEEDQITVTLYNGGMSNVYLPNPNGEITIERREDSKWINLGTWYLIIQVVPSPDPIMKGEKHTQTVSVRGLLEIYSAGTYRFRQYIYDTDELSESHRHAIYTNSFDLNSD